MVAAAGPMTVARARRLLEERFARAGLESPSAEARQLLQALLATSYAGLYLERDRVLSADEGARLRDWLERRLAREPLQHITGSTGFFGLELAVTPSTLIPRPETERLVELGLEALSRLDAPRALDVGTGSGAIALALKHVRPDAEVWATDLSASALEIAALNARRLGLELRLYLSDLLERDEVAAFAASADLIVSNPPYLRASDREVLSPEVCSEPEEALFSGTDGLDHYRRLERQASVLLRPGALLLVELDPRNVEAAMAIASGWPEREALADLTGRKRFLKLRK